MFNLENDVLVGRFIMKKMLLIIISGLILCGLAGAAVAAEDTELLDVPAADPVLVDPILNLNSAIYRE